MHLISIPIYVLFQASKLSTRRDGSHPEPHIPMSTDIHVHQHVEYVCEQGERPLVPGGNL